MNQQPRETQATTPQSGAGWRAVIGAGAVGSTLAACLGLSAPVLLVVRRPDRAARLFARGAVVRGVISASSRPIIVPRIADLAAFGAIDSVFLATKTTAIPTACDELAPLLRSQANQPEAPIIVSCQNGVEPGRLIMRLLETDRVLRMVLNFGAILDEQTGDAVARMVEPPSAIGCLNPALAPACRRIAEALSRGGLETIFDDDIERRVWEKAILNAAMSPIAALINGAIGEALDSPACVVVERLLSEAVAVARAERIDIAPEFVDHALQVYRQGAGHTPSMVEDIRRGRESEVGQLNRQIVEHARRVNVPAPTHEVIDALIEAFDWRVYHGAHRDAPGQDLAASDGLGE